MLQQQLRQRIIQGQLRQHFLSGRGCALGGLFEYRQLQLIEQYLPELLGRTQIKFLPGQRVCPALQFQQALSQLRALGLQQLTGNQRPPALYARQKRHQRYLDGAEHMAGPVLFRQPGPQCLVQAQRDVRVFSSVGARFLQFDLVKGQLLGALAGDVREVDGFVPQVFQGETVHVVPGCGGVQNVGFQHGIKADTAHMNTVIRQHTGIVFQVLSHLCLLLVLQQRLELRQHCVPVQLVRDAQIIMCQRHIGRAPGLDGKRQPDNARLHIVEARGLGIKGKKLRRNQCLQPVIQGSLTGDNVVIHSHGFGQFRFIPIQQFFQPGPELHAGIPLDQLLSIRLAVSQLVRGEIQDHVELYRGKGIRHIRLVFFRLQFRGHGLCTAEGEVGHLVQPGIDIVQTTQALQQPQCRFFTHTRHTRDVVGLVAHQGQQIDNQAWRNTKLALHPGHIKHCVGHSVHQGDVLIHQLRHILVTGGYHHWPALFGGLAGECAYHIVGFNTLNAQ